MNIKYEHIRKYLIYKFVKFIFFLGRYVFKLFELLCKNWIHKHPVLKKFFIELYELILKYFSPEIFSYGLHKAENQINLEHDKSNISIPEWVEKEMRAIHEIEPKIFPDQNVIQKSPSFFIPTSNIAKPYLELCNIIPENISHIFLIPWFERGGADLVALNYVNAVLKNLENTKILIIATINGESPWANKIPSDVTFIEFGKNYHYLSEAEQIKLLVKLMLQISPNTIHNINSELGYKVFLKHGRALTYKSSLFATCFCLDRTEDGKNVGYPITYLPDCIEFLTNVFFDNTTIIKQLRKTYALNSKKMLCHYQPIKIPSDSVQMKKYDINVLKVLWAGRLDRQKRPDILIEIIKKCKNLPIYFDVYGISVLDKDKYSNCIREMPNADYHGVFDKLLSIKTENYDVFLYTSEWDGLPTIILDAIALNLPVVASDSGGVGELIVNEETGFLISPFDKIKEYVDCLKSILSKKEQLSNITINAKRLVESRHSFDTFENALKDIHGYFSSEYSKSPYWK
jgi:glycosyltransferase involved in cell wall biosynthesis